MPEDTMKDARIRFRGIVGGIIPIILMALILFISSGRLDWAMAWALLGVQLAGTTIAVLTVSAATIVERSRKNDGAKKWDTTIVSLMSVVGLAALLVAGLDMRFGWTGTIPWIVGIAALALLILGYALLDWAMVSNEFFSTVVRIQGEKSHYPVTRGPYRFVRHPGYVGLILCVLAQPLMLGSLWALIPAIITSAILIVRTSLEDRMLQEELAGYREYVGRVHYRLLPGVW